MQLLSGNGFVSDMGRLGLLGSLGLRKVCEGAKVRRGEGAKMRRCEGAKVQLLSGDGFVSEQLDSGKLLSLVSV